MAACRLPGGPMRRRRPPGPARGSRSASPDAAAPSTAAVAATGSNGGGSRLGRDSRDGSGSAAPAPPRRLRRPSAVALAAACLVAAAQDPVLEDPERPRQGLADAAGRRRPGLRQSSDHRLDTGAPAARLGELQGAPCGIERIRAAGHSRRARRQPVERVGGADAIARWRSGRRPDRAARASSVGARSSAASKAARASLVLAQPGQDVRRCPTSGSARSGASLAASPYAASGARP